MGNKIAVNAKYYKASQASSVSGHVMRLFAEDKNAYSHLTKNNFGTPDELINDRYKAAFKDVKNLKKTSNTLIDAVLVLPVDQWIKARENGMTNEDVERVIWKTMTDIEQATGLQPIGFKMHLDEGRTLENGEIELNTHAHMQFANICNKKVTLKRVKKLTMQDEFSKAIPDPDNPKKWLYERDENGKIKTKEVLIPLKDKMPLQHLKGRGSGSVWADMQDLAFENLHEFGFERGISKEITNTVHLSKEKWIASELKRLETETEKLEQTNSRLMTTNDVLEQTNSKMRGEYTARLKAIQNFYHRVRRFATAAIRGDVETLKQELPPLVKLFEVGIPDENKADSRDFVNETIDDISDSMHPDGDLFSRQLQNKMAEKMVESDSKENPTQHVKRKPVAPKM
jgi:hypothetical protein